MIDLMDAFYTCAKKIAVEDILNRDGEYLSRTRIIEDRLKRLYEVVDEDIAQWVDDLMVEQVIVDELKEYAYFRVGFRVALELMR